eukprot:NODE_132_length_18298_cov_0.443101.p13 type:complete len:115 gc:universal NODE_132_length_18298_cov_0.443101:5996-6340(+)
MLGIPLAIVNMWLHLSQIILPSNISIPNSTLCSNDNSHSWIVAGNCILSFLLSSTITPYSIFSNIPSINDSLYSASTSSALSTANDNGNCPQFFTLHINRLCVNIFILQIFRFQ